MRRALFAVAALAACATPPTEMRVLLEPSVYSSSMSSKLGMTFTAVAEVPVKVKPRYVWRADAGYFLVRRETTAEILNLGRETTTDEPSIVWSYNSGERAALNKAPVGISVVTENAKNGKALARTDFTLAWDEDSVRAVH